ncbi:hypothetical protein ABZX75_02955 [Streptomyces sp. NPDC003038]
MEATRFGWPKNGAVCGGRFHGVNARVRADRSDPATATAIVT